jgi:hypothetical protein
MYHTAVIAVLIPILARTFASALEDAKCTLTRMRWIGGATAGLVVILAASWVYQIGYMAIAPGGYLLSRTPWMRENYVENWPTGFGVKEVVQFLKEQPGPGIVFVDPQWGNPATSLEVFGKQYPQLIVTSVTTQFLSGDGAATIKKECEPLYKTRLVIFSEGSRNQPGRAAWQRNVLERLCSDKQEIRPQPRQMPILICRF